MTKKEASFNNLYMFEAWRELTRRYVRVLDVSGLVDDFGYPTSARLVRPLIKVSYLDFHG